MESITQGFKLHTAERRQAKLRVGLFGASGAGKTMSALKMARGLVSDWDKIAIIDTENGSADLYSQLGAYKVMTLSAPFIPEKYIQAIKACADAGVEAIIVDSITHEWAGEGGILEEADRLGKTAKNSFMVWGQLTPRHNKFINSIIGCPVHIISCGRSKQDYALNEIEKNGRKVTVPEKIGLKSITREGFDYEMTVSFDLDITHVAVSTKDRTGLFQDKPGMVINEETGRLLRDWNASGAIDPADQKREIMAELKRLGLPTDTKENIATNVALYTQLALEEKNYPAVIAKLKELKVEDVKKPEAPQPPITLPSAPGLMNTNQGNQAVNDAEITADDIPVSGSVLAALMGVMKVKHPECSDEKKAVEYIEFIYGISVPNLMSLTGGQANKLIMAISAENVPLAA